MIGHCQYPIGSPRLASPTGGTNLERLGHLGACRLLPDGQPLLGQAPNYVIRSLYVGPTSGHTWQWAPSHWLPLGFGPLPPRF